MSSVEFDTSEIEADNDRLRTAINRVSGALCDSGCVVPEDEWRYGEAIRGIVEERDSLRVELQTAKDFKAGWNAVPHELVADRDWCLAEVGRLTTFRAGQEDRKMASGCRLERAPKVAAFDSVTGEETRMQAVAVLEGVRMDSGRSPVPCGVDGCPNNTARSGLCWGHLKRKARGQTVNEPLTEKPDSPWVSLMESIFDLIDIKPTDDTGWRRARDRVRKAAIAYATGNRQTNQHSRRRGD